MKAKASSTGWWHTCKPKDNKGASEANTPDAVNKNKSPGDSAKSNKKKPKIPDFNVFRKKFALIGGGVLLLIIFLVWATWFAPHATVIITAKRNEWSVAGHGVGGAGPGPGRSTRGFGVRVIGIGRRVEQGRGVLIASDGAISVCEVISEGFGVGVVWAQDA